MSREQLSEPPVAGSRCHKKGGRRAARQYYYHAVRSLGDYFLSLLLPDGELVLDPDVELVLDSDVELVLDSDVELGVEQSFRASFLYDSER